MSTLLQDLRQSFRQLVRRPAFTVTAVVTLAIAIGVNAVAFSVINGVLFKGYALRGIPYTGRVATTPGGDESGYASMAEYRRFQDATAGVLELAAEGRSTAAWKHEHTTDTAWVLYVSKGYFSIVTPPLVAGQLRVGRQAASIAAVVGERFWRDQLGARSLAGLTLQLNNVDVSVSGVIADSWTGPAGMYSPDVWLPLDDLALFSPAPLLDRRDTRWLFLMGRLRDGASEAQAHALVRAAAATMRHDWPDTHQDRGASFRLFGGGNSETRGMAYGAGIAMGLIGLVLLLACFNVANLLLAQAVERERDLSVRIALGARPSRLIRLVIVEGVVLAVAAGAVAVLIAWWTQTLVGAMAMPIDEPQHIDMRLDYRVLLFIAALVCVAGVLPGALPALSALRLDVQRILGSQGSVGSARQSSVRRWLIGAQIAGSTAFLAVAGLFLQSYLVLTTFDVGFARDRLVLKELAPTSIGYDRDHSRRYVDAVTERVRQLPGIIDAALIDRAPFFIGFDRRTSVWPPSGDCEQCPTYPVYAVGPGYFRTMGIAVTGREFADDGPSNQVVINGPMARALWPDGEALGRTMRLGPAGVPVTVIGITGPARTRGLDRETPVVFQRLGPADFDRDVTLVARTGGPPSLLIKAVQEASRLVDPDVPNAAVKTMDQRIAVQLWPFRTMTTMFAVCGTLALVLSSVGLTGMVIHAVNRRIREFGVRLSIGAEPRDLGREVVMSSLRIALPGVAAGVAIALAASLLVRFVFIGVNVLNPVSYLSVAVVQVTLVVVASVAPARRAARVDPLVALRRD